MKKQMSFKVAPRELLKRADNPIALKKQLHDMHAYQFEFLIGDLLQELGYENVEITRQSGEGGRPTRSNGVGGLHA